MRWRRETEFIETHGSLFGREEIDNRREELVEGIWPLADIPLMQKAATGFPGVGVAILARPGDEYRLPGLVKGHRVPEDKAYVSISVPPEAAGLGPFWNRVDQLKAEAAAKRPR